MVILVNMVMAAGPSAEFERGLVDLQRFDPVVEG